MDEREVISVSAADGDGAGRPGALPGVAVGSPLLPPELALLCTPWACPVTKTAGPRQRHTPRTVVCIRG